MLGLTSVADALRTLDTTENAFDGGDWAWGNHLKRWEAQVACPLVPTPYSPHKYYYSNRSASIGSSEAARYAGYRPNPIPIAEQTIKPARAPPYGKIRSTLTHAASRSPPITPRIMPITPPAS